MPFACLVDTKKFFSALIPRRRKTKARLEGLALQMDSLAKKLPPLSAFLGERFLEAAPHLEEITSASDLLVTQSESLLALATGQVNGRATVDQTFALLAGPLAYLDRWREQISERLNELDAGQLTLGRLLGAEDALQSSIAPLRFTHTMFRVESATLPEETRQIFASLTQEMNVLQVRVKETLSQQFAVASGTRDQLALMTQTVRTQTASLDQALQVRKAQIGTSVDKLIEEISKNGERNITLTSTSRAIAVEVGEIVVALQAHDIVSQRMDHISRAVLRASETLKRYTSRASDENLRAVEQAYAMLRVQTAQCQDAARALRDSGRQLEDAAGRILGHVETLDRECLLLNEFSVVTAAANGTIQVLLEMIEDVRRLTAAATELALDSTRQIEPIGALVAQLNTSVERLAREMCRIALNTQVQAVHMGAGTGLEILAAHTVEVSSKTSALAADMAGDFEQLGTGLGGVLQLFRTLSTEGREQSAVVDEQGAAQEKKLHEGRDEIFDTMRQVGADADVIRSNAKVFASEAEACQQGADQLMEIVTALGAVSEDLHQCMPGLKEKAASFSASSMGYTMRSEHETHSSVMSRLSGKPDRVTADAQSECIPETAPAVELF